MPKVPQASDIQVGSFDIGRAAKIDPGVAGYMGRAGNALGDAIGSFGAAFAEVATRANQAQSKQNFVDLQMDYLTKAESQYQDMYKTQSWDSQPTRFQSIYDEQNKSEKYQNLPANDKAKFDLWRFNRTVPYARSSARLYQQQKAGEFVNSLQGFFGEADKQFDINTNPSLNTMTPTELQGLVDERANLIIGKVKSMSDVLTPKQMQQSMDQVYGWSGKVKLDWMKRNDPDNYEKLLDQLIGNYRVGPARTDSENPSDLSPEEVLKEQEQSLDNTEDLPNFLGGPGKERKLSSVQNLIVQKAREYGISPASALAMAKIESAFDPGSNRNRSTQYKGLYQIGKSEWAKYGKGEDIYDAEANTDAFMRLYKTNKQQLEKALGRPARPGELYLAHQQGVAGAKALIENPKENVIDVLRQFYSPKRAALVVTGNGGKVTMTAGQFANLWINKHDRFAKNFGGGETQVAQGGNNQEQGTTQLPQEIQSTWNKVQELEATEPDTPLVSVLTPQERDAIKTLAPQNVPLDKITVADAKLLFEGEVGKQLQQISSLNDQEPESQESPMGLGGTDLQLSKPIKVADNNFSFSPLELKNLSKDTLRVMRDDFRAERRTATEINKGTALEMMQNRALTVLKTGEEPEQKLFDPVVVDKAFPQGSKERFFYENLTKDYKQLSDVFKNYGDKPFEQIASEYLHREEFLTTDKAKALADKKFKQLQTMVEQDPAQYVEGSTIVKQIRSQFQNGVPKSDEEKKRLIEARLSAQRAIGIPEIGRSPITDAEAATYAQTLKQAKGTEIKTILQYVYSSVVKNFGKENSKIVMEAVVKEYLKDNERNEAEKMLKRFESSFYTYDQPSSSPPSQDKASEDKPITQEDLTKIMREFKFPTEGTKTKPSDDDAKALQQGKMSQQEFENKYKMKKEDSLKYLLYGPRGKP